MEFESIITLVTVAIALYGAVLSTFNYVRSKPNFELTFSTVLFAAQSSVNKSKIEPHVYSYIKITNIGSSSIFIGKCGFVDESKKFLNVKVVDGAQVRVNNLVEPNFDNNKLTEVSSTNESIKIVTDDREVKPNENSILYFHADSLKKAIKERNAKKVFMYVSCGGIKKVIKISDSDLKQLDTVDLIKKGN